MNNKQTKKATVDAINVMIRHADKGPSGFWVEDHEGCGNPAVFPEFEEGLKRGRLVQKEHYFCPWNTAIMYGDGHGNINTGCYHSCSISKARYLTTEELKEVLARFKNAHGKWGLRLRRPFIAVADKRRKQIHRGSHSCGAA